MSQTILEYLEIKEDDDCPLDLYSPDPMGNIINEQQIRQLNRFAKYSKA